jgi:hypothetical protein
LSVLRAAAKRLGWHVIVVVIFARRRLATWSRVRRGERCCVVESIDPAVGDLLKA